MGVFSSPRHTFSVGKCVGKSVYCPINVLGFLPLHEWGVLCHLDGTESWMPEKKASGAAQAASADGGPGEDLLDSLSGGDGGPAQKFSVTVGFNSQQLPLVELSSPTSKGGLNCLSCSVFFHTNSLAGSILMRTYMPALSHVPVTQESALNCSWLTWPGL